MALADENPDLEREIHRRLLVTEGLHGQFYEIYTTQRTVEIALEEIAPPGNCGDSCPRNTPGTARSAGRPRRRRSDAPQPGKRQSDQRIRKHVAQAKEYWAKGAEHLREEDTCQAAEKGWGTVAQLTKAVATLKGWNHYDHDAIRDCVYELV